MRGREEIDEPAGVALEDPADPSRPLILGSALDKASAVVAAWLPGTEGRGVSDVLFGDHPPTGKLAFAWPRSTDQLKAGEARSREALFPVGFGLTYAKS